MKTIEITGYTINEWKEKNINVYNKIIEKNADINVDHEWCEFVYDDFVAQLENIGFRDIKVNFSGFWSQGDGASFTGRYQFVKNPAEEIINANVQKLHDYLYKIAHNHDLSFCLYRHNSRYCHENTVSVVNSLYIHKSADEERDLPEHITEEIEHLCRVIMCDIYKQLETEYDLLTSTEQIEETINLNEYNFNENGETIQ